MEKEKEKLKFTEGMNGITNSKFTWKLKQKLYKKRNEFDLFTIQHQQQSLDFLQSFPHQNSNPFHRHYLEYNFLF